MAVPPREPRYKGKPLREWLRAYDVSSLHDDIAAKDEAVHSLGTNAIPTLLRMLRTKDSRLKAKLIQFCEEHPWQIFDAMPEWLKLDLMPSELLNGEAAEGFRALGATASNAAPALVRIYDKDTSTDSKRYAVLALGGIGPAAASAVPSLLRGTTSTNDDLRWSVTWAFGQIHSQPELAVPALINLLRDTNSSVRREAAGALGNYGTNATAAVPVLAALLQDPILGVRRFSTNALKKIDLEAAVRVGIR